MPLDEEGNSSATTVISGSQNIGYSCSIAYDWIHDLVYWINYAARKVSVAFGNGSHPVTIIDNANLNPHAIAIHPGKG